MHSGVMSPQTAIAAAFFLLGCILGVFLGASWAASHWRARTATMHSRVAAGEARYAELTAQIEHQRALYTDALAAARTDATVREERAGREQTVLRALGPVAETLQEMQRKVDHLERERHTQFGAISEQLRHAQRSDELLRASTQALAGTLQATHSRGMWGEAQLRRVVESAGMTRYVDFDLQHTIHTETGSARPDLIVRLPGGKALAVDAKVPLDAYLSASAISPTAAGDPSSRRKALLKDHARAVRSHVDALSRKAYWTGLEISPEFVLCFLPSEALLAAALDEDPTLLEYAFSKRVALTSPVNLWAVLKTVAYTWTQREVSQQARELFDLGNQLFQRLGALAGHADELRRSIERTVDSYNRFAGSLESRVLVSARKFPGIDSSKQDSVRDPGQVIQRTRQFSATELLGTDVPSTDIVATDPATGEELAPEDTGYARQSSPEFEEIRARLRE